MRTLAPLSLGCWRELLWASRMGLMDYEKEMFVELQVS
jgi:hypothetical protein